MDQFTRFAIYYLPAPGAFAEFGARWLGWDVTRGIETAQPSPGVLEPATRRPRKYGFHATLKPPFRLANGSSPDALLKDARALAARLSPVTLDGLAPTRIGRFMALCPTAPSAALQDMAAACVTELDAHRAPADAAELARRRTARLSPDQDAHLLRWGYPYVLDQFRFHMTLTGPLTDDARPAIDALLDQHLPALPRPFVLDRISLAGEAADGRFHEIAALPLGHPS